MGILNNRFFVFTLIASLVIRLITALFPGFKIDVEDWAIWAIRLNDVGFSHFYSEQIFTDYAPGYLYVLGLMGWLKEVFNLDNFTFFYLLKIPALISEILIGIIVYQQVLRFANQKAAIIASSLILLNPALIFNSSLWGQVDSVSTLFTLLSVISLERKKLIPSSLFFSTAFLIKPQTAIIFPLFAYFIIKNFSPANFFKLLIPGLLFIYFFSIPFFPTNTLTSLISHIINATNVYPYNSLFAYNSWGSIGFWINDNQILAFATYKQWGWLLLFAYFATLTYLYFKKNLNLYSVTALICLGFFFLPTRIHERYLYPSIPFLVLAAAYLKSKIVFNLSIILSFIHLLNLYYVYVYYNEFYFHLPKNLYIPILYNFLGDQAKSISVLSTILFILIFTMIVKKSYEHKRN